MSKSPINVIIGIDNGKTFIDGASDNAPATRRRNVGEQRAPHMRRREVMPSTPEIVGVGGMTWEAVAEKKMFDRSPSARSSSEIVDDGRAEGFLERVAQGGGEGRAEQQGAGCVGHARAAERQGQLAGVRGQ